jgi:beta-glucosidase
MTIPLTNIGKQKGTEIVQVYVRKVNDVDGPLKTLRRFSRVAVQAGQTKPVIMELPASTFEFFDREKGIINVTPGEYEVYYGTSSDPKDLKSAIIKISE